MASFDQPSRKASIYLCSHIRTCHNSLCLILLQLFATLLVLRQHTSFWRLWRSSVSGSRHFKARAVAGTRIITICGSHPCFIVVGNTPRLSSAIKRHLFKYITLGSDDGAAANLSPRKVHSTRAALNLEVEF